MIVADVTHGVPGEGGGIPPRTTAPTLGGNGRGGGEDIGPENRPPRQWVGLWVFLGVATVLFSISLSAYVARMGMTDWRPLREPGLLWANTFVLALASLAMQYAATSAKTEQHHGLRFGIIAAGVCSFLFLLGQMFAWQQIRAEGYSLTSNPADGFFYLLTSLHGLHLIGGLVAWGKTWAGYQRGLDVRLISRLCAIYWHFLFIVWVVLFGMMLAT